MSHGENMRSEPSPRKCGPVGANDQLDAFAKLVEEAIQDDCRVEHDARLGQLVAEFEGRYYTIRVETAGE